MGNAALLSWPIIATALICSIAGYAFAAWKRASPSTRQRKQPPSPPTTPDSETPSLAHLARLEADQAELFSTLGKLTTTVKRLSSRAGMQDFRDRERAETGEPPPRGTAKAELLRYYGMSGKVGPAFAQAQLQLEQNQTEH